MTILIKLPFYFSKKLLKFHINLSRPFFSKTACAVFKSKSNQKIKQLRIKQASIINTRIHEASVISTRVQKNCVKNIGQSAGFEYSSPIASKELKPCFSIKLNPMVASTLFYMKVNPRCAFTFFPCVKRTRVFPVVHFFSSFFDKKEKQQSGHLSLKTEEIFEKRRRDWLTRRSMLFRYNKGYKWPCVERRRLFSCYFFNKKIAKKAKESNAHALNQVKKSRRTADLPPRKKAFTFATNNGIPIQNKYGHRVKVKTSRRLAFAAAGQGNHLLAPQCVIPMVQDICPGGISFTPILPTPPEIGKQFQPFVSISNLIQPAIDQLIAEYGLEMAQRKLKNDSLAVLGAEARKKKLFLKSKESAQLFTIGKKRLLTSKQLRRSKKIYYKKYNKIIRIPRQKKPIKIPMGAKIGKICIKGSYNNIILTLTDQRGDTKGWVSAGTAGFKNGRKSSHFAAESAADRMAHRSIELGYAFAMVKMKGLGGGKRKAIRRLCKSNLQLLRMSDTFAIPHNGCRRARKPRK
jgi:small subunit ribosomal protein S11